MSDPKNPLLAELAFLRDVGYTQLDLGGAAESAAAFAEPVAEERGLAAAPREPRAAMPPAERASRPEPNLTPARTQTLADDANVAPATREIIACDTLEALAALAAPCVRCRLARTRTQVVFGTGSPNAQLMFVGEAPGRDEDLRGEPFVGRAGQLLTDIIKAMKLSREQVYIANVIKCRPPENRNPEPDELDACRPFIRRQIELIRPRVIVTLGRFALQSLSGKSFAVSSVRGQWTSYESIKVMPTYHPAYLLRTPSAKKDVWADMKKVMAELGITF